MVLEASASTDPDNQNKMPVARVQQHKDTVREVFAFPASVNRLLFTRWMGHLPTPISRVIFIVFDLRSKTDSNSTNCW
jgi:hypothetical protein